MAVHARGDLDRRAELVEGLRQAPGVAARLVAMSDATGPIPSRWTLTTIRATFGWLTGYSLSGVWRVVRRADIRLRSGRPQQFSPDPNYATKQAYLLDCLHQAARQPEQIVLLFMDEMGFFRWPDPGPDWMPAAPQPPIQVPCANNNRQWRVIGVLNALTGQVNYLDNYIVGRRIVGEMYEYIDRLYPTADHIFVVQDNWSIHSHPDVLARLTEQPRIQPVWLPTYAHWLNPIEKLWRWLRQAVLRMHRWANDWLELLGRVHAFFDQFAHGSQDLLRYVGLLGQGTLAQSIHRA
jgi:hypothetical protein